MNKPAVSTGIRIVNTNGYLNIFQKITLMKNNQIPDTFYYYFYDHNVLNVPFYSDDNALNYEEIKRNNIEILKNPQIKTTKRKMAYTMYGPGVMSLSLVFKNGEITSIKPNLFVKTLLRQCGISDLSIASNDVFCKGLKISGARMRTFGDITAFFAFISYAFDKKPFENISKIHKIYDRVNSLDLVSGVKLNEEILLNKTINLVSNIFGGFYMDDLILAEKELRSNQ